jgi:hypothetical protein
MVEVMSVLPTLKSGLIELDQAKVFKDDQALQYAIREMRFATEGSNGDWDYDRDVWPRSPWDEEE